ncbi:glycosyltransferase [Psychrobacillus vulpis]|uniref:glycosyltransferase n=1 Tax=Psychrobacillus vulpis TaxID=2325572 RepID=UPI001409921D|nr:glycosyltransferase [Psychrobacillus vulpis]
MKIAYIVAEKLDKEHGVSKKILNQINFWKNEGHEVILFYFSNEFISPLFKKVKIEHIKYSTRLDFIFSNKGKKIVEDYNPDIVYFRYYLFTLSFYKILKHNKSVIEINSNDIEESRISYPYLSRLYLLCTRDLLLKQADGFITVTRELKSLVENYSSKISTIANGINEPFKEKKIMEKNEELHAIFIGSPNQKWHGIDKLIDLANHIPNCTFHIIGINNMDNPPNNFIQYGYMSQEEYLPILSKCNVGIGTLALHRKNMEEASPLKVREYLKNGLPIIIGYVDSDFAESTYPFILKLPNTDNNVSENINVIRNFILNSKDMKITKEEIECIFNENKEVKRLEFFENIIRQGKR